MIGARALALLEAGSKIELDAVVNPGAVGEAGFETVRVFLVREERR